MSTAFTGQAIATGFERRYGVLKRLGSSPLPRWGLMTAKTLSVLVTEVLQVLLVTVIAFTLGWDPQGNPLDFTESRLEAVSELVAYVKPVLTGGSGSTNLTVSMIARGNEP